MHKIYKSSKYVKRLIFYAFNNMKPLIMVIFEDNLRSNEEECALFNDFHGERPSIYREELSEEL